MSAFVELKDTLWPKRRQVGQPRRHLGGPSSSQEERAGYIMAMGQAAYHLDRLPLAGRLRLAVLILTWPWRD